MVFENTSFKFQLKLLCSFSNKYLRKGFIPYFLHVTRNTSVEKNRLSCFVTGLVWIQAKPFWLENNNCLPQNVMNGESTDKTYTLVKQRFYTQEALYKTIINRYIYKRHFSSTGSNYILFPRLPNLWDIFLCKCLIEDYLLNLHRWYKHLLLSQ